MYLDPNLITFTSFWVSTLDWNLEQYLSNNSNRKFLPDIQVCTGETYIVYLLYCSSSSISGPGKDFSDIIKQITLPIRLKNIWRSIFWSNNIPTKVFLHTCIHKYVVVSFHVILSTPPHPPPTSLHFTMKKRKKFYPKSRLMWYTVSPMNCSSSSSSSKHGAVAGCVS